MLVSLHNIRHAASVRTDPKQRDSPSYRHLHTESGASQLRRQPRHLLHVLRQLQQVLQVSNISPLREKYSSTQNILFIFPPLGKVGKIKTNPLHFIERLYSLYLCKG